MPTFRIIPLIDRHGAIFLIAALAALVAGSSGGARAATADAAMKWLAGTWTSDNNCKGGWIKFNRKGGAWTYQELAYDKGKPFPAAAAADASGVVTVRIMVPDGEYDYVNTFRGRNAFDAPETFTSATVKGEPATKSYTRCR
jgi:hypothetical protein